MKKIRNVLSTINITNPKTVKFLQSMRQLSDAVISGKVPNSQYGAYLSRILNSNPHIDMVGEGTNRNVFRDNTDSNGVVFKIPHKLVGYSDNIRAYMVSNYAHQHNLDNHIAKVSLVNGIEPYYCIAQQYVTVLDPSGDWVKSLADNLYSDYQKVIGEINKHFVLCDVNLFHTPYNFGYVNEHLTILDLGYLLPRDLFDTGNNNMVIQCPVCGNTMDYYMPTDNPMEMEKFQSGLDVYTCSNPDCEHSVYANAGENMVYIGSNGARHKANWSPVSAARISDSFSTAARDVFATVAQKIFR